MIAIPGDHTVAATLAWPEAVATRWHAVVVGAGPAGAATATWLARAGRKVLLLDRCDMPRAKVCGSCLSVRARDELRRLFHAGSSGSLVGEVPLDRVMLVAAGRAVRMPLPAGGVVSRESLDPALVRAAIAAGADWLPRADVTAIEEDPACDCDEDHARAAPLRVGCRSQADQAATHDLVATHVVIAAGLVDHVRLPQARDLRKTTWQASRVGIGAVLDAGACDLPAGELVMAVGRNGYCGIVRVEDGRIDVAAAVDRQSLAAAGSPRRAVREILRDSAAGEAWSGLAEESLAAAAFRATPPLTHTAPLVAGRARRIFRVGDAAGYVEPFTGEGIGWALTGARLLAAAILASADPARAYQTAHARGLGGPHRRCRRIAMALRRGAFLGPAIRAAGIAPWAARRVVPLLVGAADTTPIQEGSA